MHAISSLMQLFFSRILAFPHRLSEVARRKSLQVIVVDLGSQRDDGELRLARIMNLVHMASQIRGGEAWAWYQGWYMYMHSLISPRHSDF
jgi:hypothetical protein